MTDRILSPAEFYHLYYIAWARLKSTYILTIGRMIPCKYCGHEVDLHDLDIIYTCLSKYTSDMAERDNVRPESYYNEELFRKLKRIILDGVLAGRITKGEISIPPHLRKKEETLYAAQRYWDGKRVFQTPLDCCKEKNPGP